MESRAPLLIAVHCGFIVRPRSRGGGQRPSSASHETGFIDHPRYPFGSPCPKPEVHAATLRRVPARFIVLRTDSSLIGPAPREAT